MTRTNNLSEVKNFNLSLIQEFGGYVSSIDTTKANPNLMVQGSQNVYKKLNGNLAIRPGLQRRGVANTTLAGVTSSYVWNTSWGQTITMAVSGGNLYAIVNDVWTPIQTGLTQTRYVFDKWFDSTEKRDRLLFVNGTSTLTQWSGGIATFASATNTAGYITTLSTTPTAGGIGYVIGDVLTITGGTATATVTSVSGSTSGAITQFSLVIGGTSYQVGDIISPTTGPGSGASFQVTSVSSGVITGLSLYSNGTNYTAGTYYTLNNPRSGGTAQIVVMAIGGQSITGVTLTTNGSGYTSGTGKATTGGTGSGATLNITSVGTGSITIQGSTPVTLLGFNTTANMSLIINGITFYYSSLLNNSFYGISPDPTVPSFSAGTSIYQYIVTYINTPDSKLNANYIKVINNQAYIGSYTSRFCYISGNGTGSNGDFSNYSVPSPRVDGSPLLVILDANGCGIGVKDGNPYLGYGTNGWSMITFANQTVNNVLINVPSQTKLPLALSQAPYAHEFIDTVGNNIVYLAQDQQIRSLTNANNAFTTVYPSISQEVATELSAENFTGGNLKAIGEFIYLTAPNSGKTYLRQERKRIADTGSIVSEILWHSPFTLSASSIDMLNGQVITFSNSNPQIYNLWNTGQYYDDSPSTQPLSYLAVITFPYFGKERRQGLWSFDKIFTDGYITPNTPLQLTINYDYQGFSGIKSQYVNSQTYPAYLLSITPSSLGGASLGTESLGSGGSSVGAANIGSFKAINQFSITNCFNWQMVYSTNSVNSNWEITSVGTDAGIAMNQDATFIINKQ